MTVSNHVGSDVKSLPKRALYRKFPSTHSWVNMVHDDPCRSFKTFK